MPQHRRMSHAEQPLQRLRRSRCAVRRPAGELYLHLLPRRLRVPERSVPRCERMPHQLRRVPYRRRHRGDLHQHRRRLHLHLFLRLVLQRDHLRPERRVRRQSVRRSGRHRRHLSGRHRDLFVHLLERLGVHRRNLPRHQRVRDAEQSVRRSGRHGGDLQQRHGDLYLHLFPSLLVEFRHLRPRHPHLHLSREAGDRNGLELREQLSADLGGQRVESA